MTVSDLPYAPPPEMAPAFLRVRDYWRDLRRGEAKMPFADDLKLSALSELADSAVVIGVFVKPVRFRFEIVGKALTFLYGEAVEGKFLDEFEPRAPFAFVHSQSSATVEASAPTYYAASSYGRLLLPLWGEGHIGMLLGTVVQL